MNVLQRQFLEISVKVDVAGGWRVEGGEAELRVRYVIL